LHGSRESQRAWITRRAQSAYLHQKLALLEVPVGPDADLRILRLPFNLAAPESRFYFVRTHQHFRRCACCVVRLLIGYTMDRDNRDRAGLSWFGIHPMWTR
jgi:hypothetical protein